MGSLTPSTPYTPDSLHSAKSPYYENDEEQPKRFKIPRFDHDVIKPEPIDYDEYAERAKNRPRELPFQLKNWTMENFNAEHAKIKTPSPTYPTTTGFLFSENMVHSPFISPTVFHAGFPYFSSPIFNTPSSSINSLSPSAKSIFNYDKPKEIVIYDLQPRKRLPAESELQEGIKEEIDVEDHHSDSEPEPESPKIAVLKSQTIKKRKKMPDLIRIRQPNVEQVRNDQIKHFSLETPTKIPVTPSDCKGANTSVFSFPSSSAVYEKHG